MKIPVTILGGFLGAGKTTLLQRLLADPGGERLAVLVNDFGALNIDAELVARTDADQVALSNGCICCSIRDDLVTALEQLGALSPQPDRIVVEASGVSRPLAIIAAVEQALQGQLEVDATLCLVDCDQLPRLDYAMTELAIDQAASSDILVLNKCDLADEASIAATEAALTGACPGIRQFRTAFAEVPREILVGPRLRSDASAEEESSGVGRWRSHHAEHREHAHAADHDHHHDHDHPHEHPQVFETWSWTSEQAVTRDGIEALRRALPVGVLRAKGIVRLATPDGDRRAVLQVVGRRSTLTIEDSPPPAIGQLVFIAKTGELERERIADALEAAVAQRR